MSNKIGFVELATYVATGKDGSSNLTFAGAAPPTDGSVGMAFLAFDPAFATSSAPGSPTQLLMYFNGGPVRASTGADFTAGGSGSVNGPVGWSII